MTPATFGSEILLERRVLRVTGLLQIGAIGIVIADLISGGKLLQGHTLEFAAFALLTLLGAWGLLLLRYLNHPLLREKRALQARLRQKEAEIQQARQGLLDLQSSRKEIKNQARAAEDGERETYAQRLIELDEKRRSRIAVMDTEIAAQLSIQQQAYMQAGLDRASLAQASLTGVGPRLIEKLAAHGIGTAAHITPEKIEAVPNLTETMTQILLRWRVAVEARLETGLPRALSPRQEGPIRRRHTLALVELEAKKAAAGEDLQQRLEIRRAAEAQALQENDEQQSQALVRISELEAQRRPLRAQLWHYNPVTARSYFFHAAGSSRPGWPSWILSRGLPLVFTAGALFHSSTALGVLVLFSLNSPSPLRTPVSTPGGAGTPVPAVAPAPTPTAGLSAELQVLSPLLRPGLGIEHDIGLIEGFEQADSQKPGDDGFFSVQEKDGGGAE